MSSTSDHVLYKGAMFMSKDELKTTLNMLTLKEKFEFRIKRSSKNRFEKSCKDMGCKFQLHSIGMQEGSYWTIAKFDKDHSCQLELFSHYHR